MPETPGFARVARDLATRLDLQQRRDLLVMDIAERLRQAWNARGAADLAAVDEVAHTNDVAVAHAIKALDR